MKRLFILNTLLLILLLAACSTVPCEVPPSPMIQNTISPTRTRRPTPTITLALTSTRPPTATPDPRKVDPGLVYGTPCKAPCWFGLVPGKTTAQEISEIVPRLGTVDSPYDFPTEKGIVPEIIQTRLGTANHMYIYIAMDWDKEILKSIKSSTLNFKYTLSQLIAQFGEPEIVVGTQPGTKILGACQEWTQWEESDPNGSARTIFYPQQGLMFAVHVPTTMLYHEEVKLCPEMHTAGFCYYPPVTTWQELLANNYLASMCGKEFEGFITKENSMEWHGYGGGY